STLFPYTTLFRSVLVTASSGRMTKSQSFCLLAWVAKTLSSNKAAAVTIGNKVQPSILWPGGCALSGAQKVATDCAAVGGPPASGCAVARNPDCWMLGA